MVSASGLGGQRQSDQEGPAAKKAVMLGTRNASARIGSRQVSETTEQLVLDIGDRLISVVSTEIPIVIGNAVPTERRALQALLVKTAGIMRSLLDLTRLGRNRGDDPCAVARDQTIAWLAIDPGAHHPRWERVTPVIV